MTRPWLRFREKLLARVRCIASASPVGVAADVSVSVADIVPVFFVELVVCDELEGLLTLYGVELSVRLVDFTLPSIILLTSRRAGVGI